jgi:uncharacterized membrane protein
MAKSQKPTAFIYILMTILKTFFIPAAGIQYRMSLKVLGMFLLIQTSCADNNEATEISCDGVTVLFADVNTIIQSSCTQNSGCHGSGSTRGPGALLTYTQIYNARTSIKSAVASGAMPQGGSLSSDEKNAIICWIENGAQEN